MTLDRAAEIIALALSRAAVEHGRPNTWGPSELLDYCNVRPALHGRVWRDPRLVGILTLEVVRLGWEGTLPRYADRRWAI